ncbi:MAG: hypothetical protein A3G93_00285 [Nitrospinae bacterium RIFCSPLOWO2_12_FULL_45_22]|nr:MAG: hypothetical protein A3G93_00285 [Nitrospinae bacterium RIFCSPLOWO2_12_FULL_45_22]
MNKRKRGGETMQKMIKVISLSVLGILFLAAVPTWSEAGLDTITAELTNCQQNYRTNARAALDSLKRLKTSYGDLVPTLVKVVDSQKVATFGMFVDKLEESISTRDIGGAMNYLQVLEGISREFQDKL